jgi:L-ascorbate metabolism protein UlaG (beta-lactamase superfamily)
VKLTFVRHATLLLDVGGRSLLVDPMLRAAGSTPPIENTPNPRPNPLVELPWPAEDVVRGVDGAVITHLHSDHFDDAADALLPRNLPILTQPESADALRARGFAAVRVEDNELPLTSGRHGTGAIGDAMGPVCGFVVDGVYIAGDTIWCDEVIEALERHRPRAVVLNAGGARFNEGDPIVMDVADVSRVREAVAGPVVVVHLEAVNHCIERRDRYRALAGVTVPDDGTTIEL